jgi:glutaredoxin 2
MALGFFELEYESRVTAYDDESTPVKLTGKKMLPILADNGKAMNESLDIIQYLDKKNVMKVSETRARSDFGEFEKLLSAVGDPVHSLAMPYWIWTPEFTPSARQYFQNKKEEKRGPFLQLYIRRNEFKEKLNPLLAKISSELNPFYRSGSLGLYDIMLASHMWGLYVVPEFQFPEVLHEYLQVVARLCRFNYHQDYWK